jgi:peptide/nickel transport system substrate-binding protein
MKRNRMAAVGAVAAALALAATACGSNKSSGTPSNTGSSGGSASGQNAASTSVVNASTKTGGTLKFGSSGDFDSTDPGDTYYAFVQDFATYYSRPLVSFKRKPGSAGNEITGDLATNTGDVSSDGLTWTYHLRPGLKYEDGTDVKPQDVAYAVKRSFAIAELPDGPTYQTTFFLDGDKYKGPFKDGLNYKGVEVKGNDIIIKMRRPFTDMDYYASFPAFTAIPQAKDNPQTYGNHPMATGPYKFADYKPGTELKLVKNQYWDPKTDPGRIQMVDGWDFKFGQDTAKLENVIINDNGAAQTTLTYDNVSASSYRQIQSDKSRLVQGTSPCTYMWYLDMTKIKDINVRRAIGYAYPYENAWKAAGEIVGVTRLPGTSILPPGTAGRVEYDALGNKGENTDAAKAKELLAKAGYKPGQYEIKFLYATDDDQSVAAKDEIVKGLQAGGFKATPIASTTATIRTDRTDYNSPINVRSSGWCSDWPSGGSWFPAQWAGSLVGLEGMPNIANFKVKAMDDEQNRILDTLTPEEATKAWGEFDKTMEEKYYPAVNVGYSGTAMIHGSKVGGMHNDTVLGMPTFDTMYVIQ